MSKGPVAEHLAAYGVQGMVGGLPIGKLLEKELEDLRPEDLGVWNGSGFCSMYLDDVLTRSEVSATEHRRQIVTFLRICAVERIPLGIKKAHLMCRWVRLLGMINGNGLVLPCPNKVLAIVRLARPHDVPSLQSFLGSVNWFRRHIGDHAEKQHALNGLTKKGAKWNWTKEHEKSWLSLKKALMSFPVLRAYEAT